MSSRSPLTQPPHSNCSLEKPNSRLLAAQAGSKSDLLGSRVQVLSPTWNSLPPRSELHRRAQFSQRYGSLHSGCLSAQVKENLWPVPRSSRAAPDNLPQNAPNETSPFLYSLAPAVLTSPHFQPLLSFPIPVSLYMPCLPSASLHSVASPVFQETNLPFSYPLLCLLAPILSFFLYFILPSPPLPPSFPPSLLYSSTHVSGAFTDGLGIMLGVIVRAESLSLLDIYLKGICKY